MQKRIRKPVLAAAVALTAGGLLSTKANAQQTWNQTDAATYAWDIDTNWTPGPMPNAAGAVANVNNDITGAQTITIPGSMITLGTLNLGDGWASPDSKFTIGASAGAGTLIFDNGANDAQLNAAKDITAGDINNDDLINSNLKLNSNLVITVPNTPVGDIVRINGRIFDGDNGPRGITKNGSSNIELGNNNGVGNSYTGLTIINGGRLRMASGSGITIIPGDVQVNNGGTIQDSNGNGNCIADTATINLANGFYNPGFNNPSTASDTIGGFEGANQNSNAGGGAGTILFGANGLDKTFSGTFSSQTSWSKVGTGVQTLNGPFDSVISGSTPTTGKWSITGGRLELAKPDGITSLAQRNLVIGDGTQSGATRPELRLLANEQIQVRISGVNTETTAVSMNSGILNLNGHTETLGPLTVTGSGTSTIALGAGGKLIVTGAGLTVDAGATAEITSVGNTALRLPAMTLNGRLDLQDNKLVTALPVGTASGGVYSDVTGQIQKGRNGGNWSGASGIVTSQTTATTSNLTSIGIATAQQAKSLATPADTAIWGGQTVTGSDTLVMYTYGGDANLDGKVNVDDYGRIDLNIPLGTSGWFNGDFNYDGQINVDDYGIIDFNVGIQGAPFPTAGASAGNLGGVSAVPEPTSIGILAAAAGGALVTARGRRRRRLAR